MLALSLLFLCACSVMQADTLEISRIMTDEEMKKIGLDTATPSQKEAFETWVATWTRRVIDQAPSYRPGSNISLWVQSWPKYADPTKTELSKDELDAKLQANLRIDKIKDEGAIIELRDGSIWAVSPLYTYLTKNWLKNQCIKIEKSKNILFTHQLVNLSRNQTAEANMKKAHSPNGENDAEDPNQYKDSSSLESINNNGEVITLSNATRWKIAPIDMYKTRTWHEHDRIKVEKIDNFLYKFRLTNLDNGQTVLANTVLANKG